ncbi:hypothetical protein BD410DRAFT_765979 [Rickenella mellea]|uniref:DUF6699 domain-containing protein n=1 Tax=Rickenella mellea TaxID=50990 RepID=A0A4Y7QER4_9AGAM|nr:hypothetical protein BD410DRAFT_765979 [Rickenella mellea]
MARFAYPARHLDPPYFQDSRQLTMPSQRYAADRTETAWRPPHDANVISHGRQRGRRKCNNQSPRKGSRKLNKLLLRLAVFIQKTLGGYIDRETSSLPNDSNSASEKLPNGRRITSEEWIQYGRWARPLINETYVHNRTPKHRPLDWHPLSEIPNVRGRPERWMPGLLHPQIPPRPEAWRTPRGDEPVPLPHQIELNPVLEHTKVGWPQFTFFIQRPVAFIMYGGKPRDEDPFIPFPDEDYAQPATWPLVSHMVISCVGDESDGSLPWPVEVRNPFGINLGNLFDEIYKTFQEPMTREERHGFPRRRQQQIGMAYRARTAPGNEDGVLSGDRVRRVDYFGDRFLFRGLEPSSKYDGTWMMFLGPP